MRLLIGYDDANTATAAISDLAFAGFGNSLARTIEARIVCVARLSGVMDEEKYVAHHPISGELLSDRERARLASAQRTARRGAEQLRTVLPDLKGITAEALPGRSVHGALLEAADKWPADLLVVGSHGRGAIGRLMHGSVAQMCVNNADVSVRVGRERPERKARAPARRPADQTVTIVVGIDGSPASESLIRELARRHWPRQSHAWVVHVVEPDLLPMDAAGAPDVMVNTGESHREMVRRGTRLADRMARVLQATGMPAVPLTLDGYPARELIQTAEREEADCIFVCARGHGAMERLVLGSVASAVAAHAHCSVEIVRPKETGPLP